MRAVNVILIMLITVSSSESVFDKSSCEEMSEMSCDENPVRTGEKIILEGKRKKRVSNNNKYHYVPKFPKTYLSIHDKYSLQLPTASTGPGHV